MRTLALASLITVIFSGIAQAEVNQEYSYKDFTNQKFTDRPTSEFNNREIIGSCFYQEAPYRSDSLGPFSRNPKVKVFPDGITGVTFTRCNLDNVIIPPGNTVGERSSNRRIRVMNDLDDWILDSGNDPIEPMNKHRRLEAQKSVDPKDIPRTKWSVEQKDVFEKSLIIDSP